MRICPGITTSFVRELCLSLSGDYDPTVRLRWQFAAHDLCFTVQCFSGSYTLKFGWAA